MHVLVLFFFQFVLSLCGADRAGFTTDLRWLQWLQQQLRWAHVIKWQGLLKGWLHDSSYSAAGFTQPSVNTMLAGLLFWHALSCAVALVSNHDIWMLSRNVKMLCCCIRQNQCLCDASHFCAVCLHEFRIIVLNVARSVSWLYWQNPFWIHPVITWETWHFVRVHSQHVYSGLKWEAFPALVCSVI